MGIDKSRTIYHAAGNGVTERFNRTLISMLGTLEADKKKNWKPYIAPLVQAYNCIKHACTGYSPYMLLFEREPRLPVDLLLVLIQTTIQMFLILTTLKICKVKSVKLLILCIKTQIKQGGSRKSIMI